MVKHNSEEFFDSLLAEMSTSIVSTEKMGIVQFAEEIIFNGDGAKLYPTQSALLKAFYNEPLTEEERIILKQWKDDDRTTWVEKRKYISLVLEAGRRGSKCNWELSKIPTTEGVLTYKELHARLANGEKIGIKTYQIGKVTEEFITYDLKSELNAIEPVYELSTKHGRKEYANDKHPFFVKDKGWTELKDIKIGDRVLVSTCNNLFGTKKLSKKLITDIVLKFISKKKGPNTYDFYSENKRSVINLLYEYRDLFTSSTRTYKAHGRLKDMLDGELPKEFYEADKESCQAILKELCRINLTVKDPDKTGYKTAFLTVKSFRQEVKNLLFRLGIETYTSCKQEKSLKVSTKDSLLTLSEYISNDELRRDLIGAFRPKKVIKKTKFNNSNIVKWEFVTSIKCIGTHQTIALEVKPTHIIGSFIISHNSTLASIICLKEFYDLITLEDPQKTWGLLPASPIAILVMAQSKDQVKETIFAAIKGYAENSIYFKGLKDAGVLEILAESIKCPAKNVAIYAKHTNSKSLVGYTIKCMLLDEVARFETTGEDGRNKAFEIWRNVAAGGAQFEGDFKQVAISSAWEKGDPIELFYEDTKSDPQSLGFKLTTFHLNLRLKKGISPKIKSDYNTDYVRARLEYEGIRYSKFNSFIDEENLEKVKTGTTTIDAQPCRIDIESKAGVRHYAGVDIIRLAPLEDHSQLQFVHIDPALKKDSAGMAMAHAEQIEGKWKIIIDALLKWEPHVDDAGIKRIVSYIDIEEKLNHIHKVRPLYRVTFDQWNSESFIQKLHTMGIDSQQVSTSREMQFTYYTLFRDLLSHEYIVMPKDSLWSQDAITELSELVLKPNRQIIHPTAGKDLADAIVNVVYQVHQYMIRAGLNMTMGLAPKMVQSQTLKGIAQANNSLNIGSARDKLYNVRRF